MKKYYISTAIAYTSKRPHIGNTYEVVLTDAIARYKRLRGYDVYFQTGTDEHGQKIEREAIALNLTPKEYVDHICAQVKEEWDSMNTSYDRFVRTTEDSHEKIVQKIFKKLYEQGDIYKSEYNGLYCTPCESFYTKSQLVDNKCPDCGREVELTTEKAYFFRLSKYADKLINYIENNPDFIQPESRRNEMINNFIKPGLQDLCVSRSSFSWGVPVTFDDKHVIYVWIDALSNYITFVGYGSDEERFKEYWPADVHVLGKDIMRFHAIYWPAILLALGLKLPKKIFGHPWLTSDDEKMSKSKGNVMYASDLIKQFGVDVVRFFVLHETPFADDGKITYELIIERNNAFLANTLGNLVNRTVNMVNKYFDGVILESDKKETLDNELIETALFTKKQVEIKMDKLQVASALDDIFSLFRRANRYIDETTPWLLAKDDSLKPRLQTVLYNLLETIRIGAVLLQPFLPEAADKIFKQINTEAKDWEAAGSFNGIEVGNKVGNATPLFDRIDKEEKLAQLLK